jgi:anti-sigma-K factor RskA
MTVPEIHTFTGAYAVDALSKNERESFERHLHDCEPCTTESRSLQAAAAALAALVPVPASPSLRERVLTQASRASQLPARTSRDRFAHTHWESSRLWMAVAATLTLVATGLGILAVNADRRADEAERQVAEIAATPRDVDVVSRATRSGGTATLVSSREDTVFAAQGLPVPGPGPGRAYQLWVISPAGATESVGVLQPDALGRLKHDVRALAPGESVALTVEPAGGSENPTTMPLVTLPAQA